MTADAPTTHTSIAPGYNRSTSPLTYTGSQTWKVKLARAGTLRFLCDRPCGHRHEGFREDRPLAGATQTERPATRQIGPCVTAFSVSERP